MLTLRHFSHGCLVAVLVMTLGCTGPNENQRNSTHGVKQNSVKDGKQGGSVKKGNNKNEDDKKKPPKPVAKMVEVSIRAVDLEEYNAVIASFKGKVVVVDYWATWCPPCRKAFPETVKLHGLYGDDGLAVVSMAMEQMVSDEPKALEFLKEQKAGFTNLICKIDFPEANILFELQAGMPRYKVYDRRGKLRENYSLKDAEQYLEAKLKELMLEKPG